VVGGPVTSSEKDHGSAAVVSGNSCRPAVAARRARASRVLPPISGTGAAIDPETSTTARNRASRRTAAKVLSSSPAVATSGTTTVLHGAQQSGQTRS
jgi:hypothetical protein